MDMFTHVNMYVCMYKCACDIVIVTCSNLKI